MPRVFISYEAIDADFAIQLMTDLRDAGAETIIDNSVNLDGTASFAFLQQIEQELSNCQQFIVIQTPAALLSPRVRTIVDMALNHAEIGQMIEVLRVLAPTLHTSDIQDVPAAWSMAPEFDARQDYPRALVRLQLKLGLIGNNDMANIPPPVAYSTPPTDVHNPKEKGNASLVSSLSYAQSLDTKDRPRHPFKYQRNLTKTDSTSPVSGLFGAQRLDTQDRPRRAFRYRHVSLRSLLIPLLITSVLILVVTSLAVFALSRPTPSTKSAAISASARSALSTKSVAISSPTSVQHTPTATATPTPAQQIPAPAPTSAPIVNNPPVSSIQDLGNLSNQNYQSYCLSIGDISASLDQNNAYGWMCVTSAGDHVTIDTNAACQQQYSSSTTTNILARMVNYSDPNDWHCYSHVQNLGSINFPQYCQSLNEGASIDGKTAYNSYCVVSGNLVAIDTNAACQEQYNEPDAIASIQNYFDPNGWVCYGAA